ncbi:hypothetical protein SKAU_G00013780 [Synaphobranchus kaupii]|uniref:Integrase p58-like C-terminal domain-containing protein n=1 Tax=Synaphobranchus kaupii TaxID=118154 RepID=A0A9Q1GAH6_SYNKA|nr:hypothetical protein SKAU_G00013780 [Synaphobranchus kaupii]
MERALLREMEELERTIGELTRRKARKAGAITSPEWQIPAVRVSRRPDGFSGRQEDPASAQASAGVKQKRWYDTRCRGRAFAAGEQVWIYCPERKKGLSPKLRASWRGPGEIVERLSEVVYRIRMPGRGRLVVLHWLPPTGPWQLLMQLSRRSGAPGGATLATTYRPLATPDAAEPEVSSDTVLPSEPEPSDTPLSATRRPKRHRRPPGHLRDFDEGDFQFPKLTRVTAHGGDLSRCGPETLKD